ncbi:MAG TPA: bifunctional phosphoribosylaminoimidazolecarboxamide formyltransferase/IMP cyclohydrolase [Bacteroidales bacterium]|nr:bifunctional phosphoribosylaminoimidazolecarboxamide formyltransferase/IMP cyclohydrolase [Bacteroidales bacterium]HSA43092.1 bifunctional phosphoribosylaminoimidazolecarboxamide formyltransferase/IMP cyclohydrolase [Bacteroidales bacterium]
MDAKKIKRALVSVYYKKGLDIILKKLSDLGVALLSTGGTHDYILSLGLQADRVEDLTSYPSILGGRVKTLHPKVFGGILARRESETDLQQLVTYDIPEIDLVIVDLYPFEETLASGASREAIIEKIDIGGISLIRAAAKNFRDVLIVPSAGEYGALLDLLNEKQGHSSLADREAFAARAFLVSAGYDTAIFKYFNQSGDIRAFQESMLPSEALRYGENPHQQGLFYGRLSEVFTQLHGKALSYNNLVDVDAALRLISEFQSTAFVIIKHTNACGLAQRNSLKQAYLDALAADPVSAFGGILATNTPVDAETAEEINKLFFEIILAPGYEKNALELLVSKKNRILLQTRDCPLPGRQFKTVLNGVLCQDNDLKTETEADLKTVTRLEPDEREVDDLLFANIVVKHTKSNAIVLARNRQLLGSGTGQTSRVDALKQAIAKAKMFGFDLHGAVMASDAFFPFPDCVEIAHAEGIDAVIEPGGSIRDEDSVRYCDEHGMRMVFTGTRHFKH